MTNGTQPDREMWIRFAVAFLVSASLLLGTSALIYHSASQHRDRMIEDAESHAVAMRTRAVNDFLARTMSDLDLLCRLHAAHASATAAPEWREAFSQEVLAFLAERPAYDQALVVDASGIEAVRAQRDADGLPWLATSGNGSAAAGLESRRPIAQGQIAFSASALGSRSGPGDVSPAPRLSIGLGLWRNGTYIGAVYLDVLGSALLREFDRAHPESDSQAMFVDPAGRWIGAAAPTATRDDLGGRPMETFVAAFPSEWQRIGPSDHGQFETSAGLFTYAAIDPREGLAGAEHHSLAQGAGIQADRDVWYVVSRVPRATLLAMRYVGLGGLLVSDAVAAVALALGSWILAHRTLRARRFRTHVVAENAALSSTLGRYVPKVLVARRRGDSDRLGGESRFVAVLFADIRGFTRFSESRAPGDVVATLNRTLSEITAPVLRHNGILDKYVGDGLLAFFEPFINQQDAVRNAVAAARDMQRAFAALQGSATDVGIGELGLGIGINAGRVIVGNVGSEEIMDYTVVGDAVNVAARLQAEADAGQILVTAAIYEVVHGGLRVEAAAPLLLRGRREPVDVYRLRWDG